MVRFRFRFRVRVRRSSGRRKSCTSVECSSSFINGYELFKLFSQNAFTRVFTETLSTVQRFNNGMETQNSPSMTKTSDPTSPSRMIVLPMPYCTGYIHSTISWICALGRFLMKSLSRIASLINAFVLHNIHIMLSCTRGAQ